MSFDQLVEQHHKVTFAAELNLALSYNGSKFRPFVTEQTCAGEATTAAELIGDIEYMRGTGRRRTNIENVPARVRRWLVYRGPIETGQYLDKEDKFRQAMDASSALMQRHVGAVRKGIDDTILGVDQNGQIDAGGVLGPVLEGKEHTTAPKSLPSKHLTVHGGAGLTIAKLRKARKQLGLDENDMAVVQPVMAITTSQHDDLLGIVETASASLNMLEQPHIVEGKVKRLMGFNFVESNRLPHDGTSRSCPVWLKDKVVLGVYEDVKGDMWNDTSARNTPYMHVECTMDATRTEDEGVHVIECVES